QDAAPFAVNLIHQPDDPEAEIAFVKGLYARGVRVIEASAFMALSPAVVLFRALGLAGAKDAATRVIVKLSHPSVAEAYLSPAPEAVLRTLAEAGHLRPDQAAAARAFPVATDITVEADSGGHTDRRPLTALFPLVARLRQRVSEAFPGAASIRLGAAGGLGTPEAIAAAFALGAQYVVTGSINQATREARTSDIALALLCAAKIDDTAMAPAADMFEIGAEVQVLKRGTLFAQRATRLGALYRQYESIAALPETDRNWLEGQVLRGSIDATRAEVRGYFAARDPALVARMRAEPKLDMALIFRSYLGQSSGWARDGLAARQADMQIWCGPAMGAFNAFVEGSRWQEGAARSVAEIADLLMVGAALHAAQPGPPLRASDLEDVIAAREPGPPDTGQTGEKHHEADENMNFTEEQIEDMILAEMAGCLEMAVEDIDPEDPFDTTDLDSAQALLMMGKLEAVLGRKLSPTLIWNYASPRLLSERLARPVKTT
ncbi:MAG: phosphopantetheine-binding protein, partial [Pseudomonadota bacterium]